MLKIESRAGKGHTQIVGKTNVLVPAVARETESRAEGQMNGADEAIDRVPDARESEAAGDDGHGVHAIDKATFQVPSSPPRFSSDPRIQDIMAAASDRKYWMNLRLQNTARCAADLRRLLEPGRGQEDEWSAETKKLARAIVAEAVAAAHHAKRQTPRVRSAKFDHVLLQHPICYGTAKSLADYEANEDECLQRMVDIAGTLLISAFVADCKGFTLAGLAVLIGHAGDFRDYPKKGHLWKRFGLAPFDKDGVMRAGSTWCKFGGLTAEDWTDLGYKRSRLGDIFGKIVQPLFRAQWQTPGKNKSGEPLPACAQGHYGDVYGRYKARQKMLNESGAFAAEAARQSAAAKKAGRKPQKALLEGKLPDSAINSRALRRMAQRLVSDLQSAWWRLGDA